jgi:hypothetical protein
MHRLRSQTLIGAFLLGLYGCTPGSLQPPALRPFSGPSALAPTAGTAVSPSPEIALATLPPSETPEPSSTPEPTATLDLTPTATAVIDPTYLYFLTVTPTATPDPYSASIRINAPGPMSKVISPIDLRAFIETRFAGPAQVELYGEDGRLLYRKTLRTYSFDGQDARLALMVPFEVHAAGELGRLQISTLDANQRLTALGSVHLLLLSSGDNQITPPGDLREAVLLDFPAPNGEIFGGQVNLAGRIQPQNKLPVFVELVTAEGQALMSRVLMLAAPDGTYQTFESNLSYQVESRTPALLVIRQSDGRISGPFYLYSQPIFLSP